MENIGQFAHLFKIGDTYETSPEINELVAALIQAKGMMDGIEKSGKNDHFKRNGKPSPHHTIEDVIHGTEGQLLSHGLVVIQMPTHRDGLFGISSGLYHKSGQFIRGWAAYKPARGDDVQAQGSCITYGRRYGQVSMLNLAEKDDDGNAAAEKETAKAKKDIASGLDLDQVLTAGNADHKAFCLYWVNEYNKTRGETDHIGKEELAAILGEMLGEKTLRDFRQHLGFV